MKKKPRFGSISKLRSLALNGTVLTEVGATFLSHFHRILENFSFKMFEKRDGYDGWELLESFTALKRIDVKYAIDANEILFAFLRTHPTITRLNTPIFLSKKLLLSGLGSHSFRNLISLVLYLGGPDFLLTPPDLYGLLALENLTDLTLMPCRCEILFLGDVLGLGAMTRLARLNISDHDIDSIVPISRLTNLFSLKVRLAALGPENQLDLLSNLVHLRTLHLAYFNENGCADMSQFKFLKSLEQLVDLNISCGPYIPTISIMTLLSETCPNLESFRYRSNIVGLHNPNICACERINEMNGRKLDFVSGFGSLKFLSVDTDAPYPSFMRLTSVAHSLETVMIIPAQTINDRTYQWRPPTWTRDGKICQTCENRCVTLRNFYSDANRFPCMKNYTVARWGTFHI